MLFTGIVIFTFNIAVRQFGSSLRLIVYTRDKVEWSKNGVKINTKRKDKCCSRRIRGKQNLFIYNITEEDDGTYEAKIGDTSEQFVIRE